MKNLNKLYVIAIAISVLAIAALLYFQAATQGVSSLWTYKPGASNILYALGFWVASGTVAGLILGRMDAAVDVANASNWSLTNGLDRFIVAISCVTLRNGYVVQQQIANLFSGPLGVGVVYLTCLGIYAITGNALFSEYPGYTLMVIPFVTMWKIVENWTRQALVQRRLSSNAN